MHGRKGLFFCRECITMTGRIQNDIDKDPEMRTDGMEQTK